MEIVLHCLYSTMLKVPLWIVLKCFQPNCNWLDVSKTKMNRVQMFIIDTWRLSMNLANHVSSHMNIGRLTASTEICWTMLQLSLWHRTNEQTRRSAQPQMPVKAVTSQDFVSNLVCSKRTNGCLNLGLSIWNDAELRHTYDRLCAAEKSRGVFFFEL